MKFKKVLVATAMVGVLATGVVGYGKSSRCESLFSKWTRTT